MILRHWAHAEAARRGELRKFLLRAEGALPVLVGHEGHRIRAAQISNCVRAPVSRGRARIIRPRLTRCHERLDRVQPRHNALAGQHDVRRRRRGQMGAVLAPAVLRHGDGSPRHRAGLLVDAQILAQQEQDLGLVGDGDLRAQRRDGDLFSIVRTSAPDDWTMPPQRIGSSFGRTAGAALKELTVSDLPSDLGATLQLAVRRSAQVEDASRTEYYVVGDRRAWDWATDDDKPRAELAKGLSSLDKEREHVTVLAVGGQHDNLAVVDVKLQDRLAIASVPVTLGVDVMFDCVFDG